MVKLKKLHKYASIICVTYLLMAAFSGSLHIVMSYSKPPTPKSASLSKNVSDLALVKKLNLQNIQGLSLKESGGQFWWQVVQEDSSVRYFNYQNDIEASGVDQDMAVEIAKTVNSSDKIKDIKYVTEFDHEYISIFRILPVYRIQFENSLEEVVYVSTVTGGITLYSNKYKRITSALFSTLHKFSFIPNKTARDAALATFLSLVIITAISGIFIFSKQVKKVI